MSDPWGPPQPPRNFPPPRPTSPPPPGPPPGYGPPPRPPRRPVPVLLVAGGLLLALLMLVALLAKPHLGKSEGYKEGYRSGEYLADNGWVPNGRDGECLTIAVDQLLTGGYRDEFLAGCHDGWDYAENHAFANPDMLP